MHDVAHHLRVILFGGSLHGCDGRNHRFGTLYRAPDLEFVVRVADYDTHSLVRQRQFVRFADKCGHFMPKRNSKAHEMIARSSACPKDNNPHSTEIPACYQHHVRDRYMNNVTVDIL